MSTLATNAITDASGGNTATINSYTPTESNMAGRNRLINSDMRIDQRNAGASVTLANTYGLDRWAGHYLGGGSGRFTAQRSTTAPAGFTNSQLITVTTADAAPSSTHGYALWQSIEGFNTADFGWGTASAQTVTLSFRVRSSVTGTFPFIFYNSAGTRAFGGTYTISAANVFEEKAITVAGDTSGVWATDNNIGVQLLFGFGGGSGRTLSAGWQAASGSTPSNVSGCTSLIATNGATFYITGVQLEAGSVATPFERRQYGQEELLCMRYYNKVSANDGNGGYASFGSGYASGSASALISVTLPVAMRSAPTVILSGTNRVLPTGSGNPSITGTTYIGTKGGYFNVAVSSGLGSYTGAVLSGDGDATAFISYSAEL